MKIEFQKMTIDQPPEKDESPGEISATSDQFSNVVLNAEAALRGWELRFSDSDHEFHQGFVRITNVEVVEDRKVRVTVTIGLRDDSGNWDDKYEGKAEILIIAEVADN